MKTLRYEIRCTCGRGTGHDGADLEYQPDDGGERAKSMLRAMGRCGLCGHRLELRRYLVEIVDVEEVDDAG